MKQNKDLKRLRDEIDQINMKLLETFIDRLDKVKEIGDLKKENNMDIEDLKREDDILRHISSMIEDEDKKLFVLKLFKEVISISKEYQQWKDTDSSVKK